MRTAQTFSIEREIANGFYGIIEEKGYNKNRVIEQLLSAYIEEHQFKMVECKECNAAYSTKLSECPQCRIGRRKQEKEELLKETEAKREKMAKWVEEGKAQQQEVDILDVEIASLKKELYGV